MKCAAGGGGGLFHGIVGKEVRYFGDQACGAESFFHIVALQIDPDIDLERNYVEKTLSSTGLVTEISHFLPDNPMKEATTATGGTFHSNGEIVILKLDESIPNP